jgi:hypothetical protein
VTAQLSGLDPAVLPSLRDFLQRPKQLLIGGSGSTLSQGRRSRASTRQPAKCWPRSRAP